MKELESVLSAIGWFVLTVGIAVVTYMFDQYDAVGYLIGGIIISALMIMLMEYDPLISNSKEDK